MLNCFHVLPTVTVASIDSLVRREVVPYVKQLSALPSDIQSDAHLAAETNSPTEFFGNLWNAWHAHNECALEIDNFICSTFNKTQTHREYLTLARPLLLKA